MILLLLTSLDVSAQNIKCSDLHDSITSFYEKGWYKKTINLINSENTKKCPITKKNHNKFQKILISSYIEDDELELAEEKLIEFVKKNPYYSINDDDPEPFKLEVNYYKTHPLLSTYLKIGINRPQFLIQKKYMILDSAYYEEKHTYENNYIPTIGLGVEFHPLKKISVGLGVLYRQQTFNRKIPVYNSYIFNYEETSRYINIPVNILFTTFSFPKFSQQVYLGIEFQNIINSYYSYNYDIIDNTIQFTEQLVNRKQTNVDINKSARTKQKYGYVVGLRHNFKIKNNSAFIEFKYIKEFSNYMNPESHFETPQLYLMNYYTNDDFTINTYEIIIGFNFNLIFKVYKIYK